MTNPCLTPKVVARLASSNVSGSLWHTAEYLKSAADAVFGSDEKAGTKWFEAKRHILRHDPKGVDKVRDALRHLLRKG